MTNQEVQPKPIEFNGVDQAAAMVQAPKSEQSTTNSPDLFDLERLRLPQDFAAQMQSKKVLLTVPIRKPDKFAFIRTHPEYQFPVLMLELKEERAVYVADLALQEHLPNELSPALLVPAITRQDDLFLWPLRLPKDTGRQDEWSRSSMEAAVAARTTWLRVVANIRVGGYEVYAAAGNWPDPTWPNLGFEQILKLALRDRFIGGLDHPVIRRLRGEV